MIRPPLVLGPYQHEEVGEAGHGDPEERERLPVPHLAQLGAVPAADLHRAEIAGGLEAGGHHQRVHLPLDPGGVDHPGIRAGRQRVRHELDVGAHQRLEELTAQDGPLAAERVPRGHRLLQLGVFGEDLLDVPQRRVSGPRVAPGPGTGKGPRDLAPLLAQIEPQPVEPPGPRQPEDRPLERSQVAVVLGQQPAGLALEDVDLPGGARQGGARPERRSSPCPSPPPAGPGGPPTRPRSRCAASLPGRSPDPARAAAAQR